MPTFPHGKPARLFALARGRVRSFGWFLALAAASASCGPSVPSPPKPRTGPLPIEREWLVRLPSGDSKISSWIVKPDRSGGPQVFQLTTRTDWDHLRSLSALMTDAGASSPEDRTILGVRCHGSSSHPCLAKIASAREEADHIMLEVLDWAPRGGVGSADIIVQAHIVVLPRTLKEVRFRMAPADLREELQRWRKTVAGGALGQ